MPANRQPRDEKLVEIETQVRVAIREAVNQRSRKPFRWGGLSGYQQLEAIADALTGIAETEPETGYLKRLSVQVNRAVEKNRTLAHDLQNAHDQLLKIANCLRYPADAWAERSPHQQAPSSHQVKQAMQTLMQEFKPDLKRQPAQAALHSAWHRTWNDFGSDLLHCYDIPALPPDNLQLEALFNRLRRHQRRISGRKSTRELRDFGHYQVLFLATSESDLLHRFQHVSLQDYEKHRRLLAEAEKPRQFLHSLHRNPAQTIQRLIAQHTQRRSQLYSPNQSASLSPFPVTSEPVLSRECLHCKLALPP